MSWLPDSDFVLYFISLHPSALLLGWLLAVVCGCSRDVFLLVCQKLVSKQAGSKARQAGNARRKLVMKLDLKQSRRGC